MKIVPATNDGLQEALRVILEGGVVAHPTETCYGFACDLTDPAAVQRLFVLKDRDPLRPVSGLFESVEMAKKFVEWNERSEHYARKHLPGPCTLVLKLRKNTDPPIFPTPTGGETLGVRISSHNVAQKLTKMAARPLSTTSANLHKKPAAYSVQDLLDQFEHAAHQPDLIIDGGKLPYVPPSTVIDLTAIEVKTLR